MRISYFGFLTILNKPVGKDGIPKSRPVVGAHKGLTTAIGDLLADILEPLASTEPLKTEAHSTEELLRAIQEANSTLEGVDVDSVVLASMDVVSLYPSIDQKGSAALVREAFIQSDIKVDNVDWEAATLYLALTVSKEELEREGYDRWVPRRTTTRGRRPTVRTARMAGPLSRTSRTDSGPLTELEDEAWLREEELDIGYRQDPEPTLLDNDHNWTFPGELTTEAKKQVLGKVLEVAMRTTF